VFEQSYLVSPHTHYASQLAVADFLGIQDLLQLGLGLGVEHSVEYRLQPLVAAGGALQSHHQLPVQHEIVLLELLGHFVSLDGFEVLQLLSIVFLLGKNELFVTFILMDFQTTFEDLVSFEYAACAGHKGNIGIFELKFLLKRVQQHPELDHQKDLDVVPATVDMLRNVQKAIDFIGKVAVGLIFSSVERQGEEFLAQLLLKRLPVGLQQEGVDQLPILP
jgi:hypothetical protein